MFMETETLRSRLLRLRLAGHRLADVLQLQADQIDAHGEPPPRSISEDLRSYQEQFSSLSSLFYLESEPQNSGRRQSFTDMETELEYRDTARQATTIARSVLQITSRDQQPLPGLDELQTTAREMVATLGMRVPRSEIAQFAEGRHVWCDLLRMIREGDSLSDAEWTALNATIESSLGRSLAVAAARGRLRLPGPVEEGPAVLREQEPVPAPPTLESPPETTAEAIDPAQAREESVPPPALPSLANQSTISVTGPASGVDSDSSILRAASRSSAVVRAVTKSRSEISATRPVLAETLELPSSPEPLDITSLDETLVATTSPAVEEPSFSVFDDIEPVALNRKFAAPAPAREKAACPAFPKLPSTRPKLSNSPSSSIFDDDDEDELVMDREDDPAIQQTASSSSTVLPAAPSPLAERLLSQARFTDATGPAASLATSILNGREEDRIDLIPDLILHLLHEGRPGLAYHLSRCLESRGAAQRPFVPSWLIRTWTFGQALVFPKGQLAGLLQDDLQHRPTTEWNDTSRPWKLALSLLVRASTLRPAIIAPATRAASVLRDFQLQAGCVQLYNYCSRIGTYGERIQGVFPGLFKLTSATAPYSDQLSTLRADIARWKESPETVRLKSQLATPLFQKTGWSLRAGTSQRHPGAASEWMNWQIALRWGASLVSPVIEDRRSELARVKTDIEEISTKLSVLDLEDDRRPLSQPEIRVYLRQATTFAQRWISLHSGAATSEAQNYLPQAAVELRSEIQNRHTLVTEELQALAADETSFEVRMAVACLLESVAEVHDLVNPHIAIPATEADPRHLLHADLLKISGLHVGANWEPEVDTHRLEDEILAFLSQPQPDWATAFKMQLSQRNHALAERILSLSIWPEEEREALRGVLTSDRLRQRSDFAQELQAVHQLLADSVQLDILQESERAGFETRLARLKRIVASDNDVSSGVIELERVRELLVKRRERETDRIRSRLHRLSPPPTSQPESGLSSPSAPDTPPPRRWMMDFNP